MSSSAFVVEWVARIASERADGRAVRRALDVATGTGRHAVVLARAGFRTFGVDVRLDALRDARNVVLTNGGGAMAVWCADLTQHPLPRCWFDLVVVTRYLQRDLFPALRSSVKPGGAIVYETFTTRQRQLGRPPTSADHLLEPGELRARFEGFDLLADEEVVDQDAVARVVARRRSAS
jgi:tellurite methyltransferase